MWRLHLTGHDVGDRWTELAGCWDQHADGRLYPFNDWHGVMTYLGSGREAEVARVVGALERSAGEDTEVGRWTRAVASAPGPGFSCVLARTSTGNAWSGCTRRASSRISFGGSHAQRDVIDWTLTEAAVRGGLTAVAEALAHERLALKPHSPINRALLERARAHAA